MTISFPYKDLRLFYIIDEIDIPLLCHYKDGRNNDILTYIVEINDDSAVSLIWRATERNIFGYLNNKISLLELITDKDKEFLYLTNSNPTDLNTEPVTMFSIEDIPSEYLPNANSYYGFPIPDRYDFLLKKIK
jgi:hypothetical protein